jgi:hypothetical protein
VVLAVIGALVESSKKRGPVLPGASAGKTRSSIPSPSPTGVPPLDASGALLDNKGIGIDESSKFTTDGDWEVHWAYDCSVIHKKGQFAFGVVDSKTRWGYPDVPGVKVSGDKGSGVQQYKKKGSHFLLIDSKCLWHVVVKG